MTCYVDGIRAGEFVKKEGDFILVKLTNDYFSGWENDYSCPELESFSDNDKFWFFNKDRTTIMGKNLINE